MILFPPAKINLGLNILFKREDGYHEIDSVMLPIPIHDVLEVLPYTQFEFHQSGLTIDGSTADNLCVKAFNLLREKYNLPPVYIHLRKEIPMGAGLGGGSADAAYVLKGLNDLFELNCSIEELETLAAQLGSDCAFFIKNCAQVAKGRGEILSPCDLDLKGFYLKIVNPGIHVGTKEAYAGVILNHSKREVEEIVEGPIHLWRNNLFNEFEVSVFQNHTVLANIKSKLYEEGAVYASMTGSGSTIFGIFEKEPVLSFVNSVYLEKIVVL